MVRKLGRNDHAQVMELLAADATFNLFIIGDIEAFGYEQDFQELWGDFNEVGELRGILLRYFHSYLPYGVGEFDTGAFMEIINRDPEFEMVSGKAEIVEKFISLPVLEGGKKDRLYFAELQSAEKLDLQMDVTRVNKATLADVDRLMQLRDQIPSFTRNASQRDSTLQAMEKGVSRTFYIEDAAGNMVSAASTSGENSLSAMVVGVCSLPEFRKQGFASQCMTALCKEVLAEGRSLCLFYSNPEAGSIYKRLGFQDIGHWCLYRPQKEA